jgi:DNA-binding helix-hairpin-helix protein with protein kinase domain
MMGIDTQGLDQLVDLYNSASDLQQSYEQTARVLDGFRNLSVNTNISPSDLLKTFAIAARQKGGVYKSAYDADMAAIANAQARAAAFNRQAEQTKALAANPNIAANLNNLAVINQRTGVILQDLTASVQRANALAAQSKEEELQAGAALNERQKAEMERFIEQQNAVKLDWSAPKREDLLKGTANTAK